MSQDWFTNLSVTEAISLAERTRRPLLVDFWSPTCLGCAKLAVTTLRDPGVCAVLDLVLADPARYAGFDRRGFG